MKIPCLWFTSCLLFSVGFAHAQPITPSAPALQAREKLITSGQAMPLDLSTNYTTPVSRFDHIDRFPAWRTVPRGFQMFVGVPLDIEGMICLWGAASATNHHIIFPEERLGIAVNQKFETLYVYHGAFFSSSNGVPIYSLVFRYADGTSVTNTLNYAEDIYDWHAHDAENVPEPTAQRSTQAWVGGAFPTKDGKNDLLHFTITSLTNPQPALIVQSIDVFSCKSRTTTCIMAMTVGKAGLVKSEP